MRATIRITVHWVLVQNSTFGMAANRSRILGVFAVMPVLGLMEIILS